MWPRNRASSGLAREMQKPACYWYRVYGIRLQSDAPLGLPECSGREPADITLRNADRYRMDEAIRGVQPESDDQWFFYSDLPGGSSYLRWNGVGEYLVSEDGRDVLSTPSENVTAESFQVYLLGRVLSFAIVKLGLEPLHATAVVANGEALAFLGPGGFGKSTLAASFLNVGYPLLTDDLLIIRAASGSLLAYPGPPRIKLFPKIVRRFLGKVAGGVTMNVESPKLVIPLDRHRAVSTAVPIRRLYVLASPAEARLSRHSRIETLSSREAFVQLVRNSGDRLERLLIQNSELLKLMSVRKLYCPRDVCYLPRVRDAILADILR
jgi:hypothetical protein